MSDLLKEVLELAQNDELDYTNDFTLIERGDWEIDYKDYANKSNIVQHNESGRYFEIYLSRSGSYYSDYDYSPPQVWEVIPKEITVTSWIPLAV